jgi:uncharacterized protein (UPF0333 family)
MVKQSSKGQVSLEYLMTYGIAIAIVVIAVAALYSMGVFKTNTTSTPPCTNCFSDFAYNAHTYNGSALTLELKNGPAKLSYIACSSPSACTINTTSTNQTSVEASALFRINIPGTSNADVPVSLNIVKDGSTLNLTRNQTVGKDYFK